MALQSGTVQSRSLADIQLGSGISLTRDARIEMTGAGDSIPTLACDGQVGCDWSGSLPEDVRATAESLVRKPIEEERKGFLASIPAVFRPKS